MVQPHLLLVIAIAEEDKLCMFFKCTLHVCTNHTVQRQGRGLGAVWACASKHWHNIEEGGGGGGVYSMLLT